jgi:hypothetical protein
VWKISRTSDRGCRSPEFADTGIGNDSFHSSRHSASETTGAKTRKSRIFKQFMCSQFLSVSFFGVQAVMAEQLTFLIIEYSTLFESDSERADWFE